MDFDFSDDQEMLRDSVRKWVDKAYGFEQRRSIVKAGGFSAEAWSALADLGLTGLQVPEAQGGMGFGPVDAMVVMEELGRGIVLEPYAAVALVATHLLKTGKAPSAELWLQGIASGKERVVLAHQERSARYKLARLDGQRADLGEAEIGDAVVAVALRETSGDIGRALQRVVVDGDEHLVARQLQVRLDEVGTEPDRELVAGERVLRQVAARAPMRDHERRRRLRCGGATCRRERKACQAPDQANTPAVSCIRAATSPTWCSVSP